MSHTPQPPELEALSTRPALRRALRQLYPECPAWARRFLVINPAHPPRTLPPALSTGWVGDAHLDRQLFAAVEERNQIDPRWRVVQSEGWKQVRASHGDPTWDPPGSVVGVHMGVWSSQGVFPNGIRIAAAGGIIEILSDGPPESPNGFTVEMLPIQRKWVDPLLTGSGPEPQEPSLARWSFRVPTLETEPVQRWMAYIPVWNMELFADGLPSTLPLAGQAWDAPKPPPDHGLAYVHADLAARWERLPTAAAQAEVAGFWLGHSNPALAQLGMQVMTRSQGLPRSMGR